MSDFDREAEREKLRKKYEAERTEREATQRMSDLLLRGATMTNRHCEECGDPLFRHEGRTFCPTCQREVEPADAAADSGATPAEQPASTEESAPEAAVGADVDEDGDTEAEAATTIDTREDAGVAADPAIESEPDRPAVSTIESTGIAGAIAALASTIDRLAVRAAEEDDPRRAKEYLEAAEAAAETIESLRGD